MDQLPEEVLISILSRMTMKQAARTSVISRGWQKLWTLHPCLDFDCSHTSKKIYSDGGDSDLEYVNWVNHIVKSCRSSAPVLDEFKVCFDLDENYKGDIDEWVSFAIEKKVKVLELSLYGGLVYVKDGCYRMQLRNLRLPSFTSLTSLVLKHVNVSDGVIAYFLSNSPFLENLCVGGSQSLVHFRVVGPSLRLKYLELTSCMSMESLEIDVSSLLSLKYTGKTLKIRSMNAPNLVELRIGGRFCFTIFTPEIPGMPNVYLQLRQLEYVSFSPQKWKDEYTIWSKLKELRLWVDSSEHESLVHLSSLINACPSLIKFTLELVEFELNEGRKRRRVVTSPHHSLKVVEINGFVGYLIDTEFCAYLIENAINLEKIIINPSYPSRREKSIAKTPGVGMVKRAREHAEQLRSEYFLGDKLVFCCSDF